MLPGLLGRQRPSVRKNSCKCKIFGLIMAGGVRAFVRRLQKKAVGDFLNKLRKDIGTYTTRTKLIQLLLMRYKARE